MASPRGFLTITCGLALFGNLVVAQQVTAEKILTEECKKIIHSQESSLQEKKQCLKDFYTVKVTARRLEEPLAKIPAAVSVITPEQLERPSAISAADVLGELPGIEISDAGEAGLKRIRLRGEDAQRSTLLIDGQEIFDPRDVGTPILIAPEMIERIEVLRGPSSVLYGSRAMGGVVNVITKKGGYHALQGEVSTLYDSRTNGFQEFGTVYGAHKGFNYRIAMSDADHGDRHSARGHVPDTSYENRGALVYLGYTQDAHEFALRYDQFEGSSEVYVAPEVKTTPPFKDFRISAPQRDRERYSFAYDYTGKEQEVLRSAHVDFYRQDTVRQFDTFSTVVLNPAIDLTSNTDIYSHAKTEGIGSNAYGKIGFGDTFTLLLGMQGTSDDLHQSRLREVRMHDATTASEFVVEDASLISLAAYSVATIAVTPSWELSVGGRESWVEHELESTTRAGLSPRSAQDAHFVANAALSYSGIQDMLWWIGVAQGYQFATLSQAATGAFAGPSFVNPHSELTPETSTQTEFGMRYTSETWRGEGALFFTRSDNYIDHVLCSSASAICIQPTGARDRVYINVDEAFTFGGEGKISYAISSFEPYLSATWLRRRFEQAGTRSYETGLPVISARVGSSARTERYAGMSLWGDLYTKIEDGADEVDGTDYHHYAGWATVNAAAGVDVGKRRDFTIGIELLNILNRAYTPVTENIPARGATVLVRVGARF